ncbi:uncharacterized protein LOC111306139 isoform X2 [Durio zibethinus]|uniref:Uncharacterized protein LOC111306139 isoform X1 n=1 Tax=Durio zibethinus TaxID=66656 RepID=A0A6P6A444_DURZI|nr:uncharacterized protein LOC111306139 isoform X1 [Durio zibethinus]XP_022759779.1 uncharacterized protein LOC111306139 isoform X2 [Durio zibethinus]
MYPRVTVRAQEEDDDHFPPPNDCQSSLFLRLIESLSKQEKENQIDSPPSIARITKAFVTSPATTSLSASEDAGAVKRNKQIGKDTKSNAKANSIPPPRAVLSSPDNDGIIGSRNKLNYARSSASKKRPPEQIKPAGRQTYKNLNRSPNVTQSSPNIRKGPKSEYGSLAGRMRKDPLKPVVPRQKAHTGDGKSSSLGS